MGNSSTNNFELNILGLGAFPIELQQVLNGNIKNEIIPQKMNEIYCNFFTHPSLHWKNYLFNTISEEVITESVSFCKNNEKCVLIVYSHSLNAHSEKILTQINSINEVHHPFIIFITEVDENANADSLLHKQKYLIDPRNLLYTHYVKDTIDETIMIRLLRICSYYNELGDSFSFPQTKLKEPITKDVSIKKGIISNDLNLYNKSYSSTINILLAGQPGVGKSSFINMILGEKRCKEGKGKPVTSKIVKYLHQKYPITLYDTPGFESEKDVNRVMSLIEEIKRHLLDGKDQIHFILFLINAETSRTLLANDIIFIKKLYELKIDVFFVVTRSMSEAKGNSFKEVMALTLKDELHQPVDSFKKIIFPIHLLNEKEDKDMNTIHQFGISNLFDELYKKYSTSKVYIKPVAKKDAENDITSIDESKPDYWEQVKKRLNHSIFFQHIVCLDDIFQYHVQKAIAIIASFTVAAAAIGASPIPIADWFILTPIQLGMAGALAAIYGIFKTKEELMACIKSLGINLAVSGVGRGIGSLLKLIPGIGTIAGMVLDGTVSAVATSALGWGLQQLFEKEVREKGTLKLIIEMVMNFNQAVDAFKEIANLFRKPTNAIEV